MAKIQLVEDMKEWQWLWDAAGTKEAAALLVFKRSPICPTSHFVEGIFNRFIAKLRESENLRIISVDVISARPISQRIAADTGVRHQSPQALLICAGQKVVWNASHGDINEETLGTVLGGYNSFKERDTTPAP